MKLNGSDYLLAFLAAAALAAGVYHFNFRSDVKSTNTTPSVSTAAATSSTPAGSAPATSTAATVQPTPVSFQSVENSSLHNAFKVTDKVSAGAKPDSEAAFKALSEMGVKTIISVDAAKPDLETAHKYGLKYVHLPIRYGKVTDQEGKEIAKALNEMPGPIYLHCPHGKNRAAAAVAMGCVMNGMIEHDQVESLFKTFGTGKEYQGLRWSVSSAKRVPPEELKAMKVQFQETHSVEEMAEAMADILRSWDDLKAFDKFNWSKIPGHPELSAKEESQKLYDMFVAMEATKASKAKPPVFQKLLRDSIDASKTLADIIAMPTIDGPAAKAALERINVSCTQCHKMYRE